MSTPQTPWPNPQEVALRFKRSTKAGHAQLFFKCSNCGLEFMLMTWRTEREIAEEFGVSVTDANAPVGIPGITCPECSVRGRSQFIYYHQAGGPICGKGF